jgi:CO/xanthine dehydrogenase Mo-binding subunit
MTELLNKEFSRKTLVKRGGALIVGFSLARAGLPGKAQAAAAPDPDQIDTWISIHADNTASIKTGIVEFGQGSATGLLQIAGEELDMDMSQLRFINYDSDVTPATGDTGASFSIRKVGPQIRAATAHARQALLGLASTSLGVPVAGLTVKSGVVSGGGKSVTYGDLIGDKLLNVTLPSSYKLKSFYPYHVADVAIGLEAGQTPAKPVSSYKLVGTRVPRVDVPAMVTGTNVYMHHVRVPGMLHGRVVRPRGQSAFGSGAPIVSVDASSIKHISNVQIVRKGDFLGVVAPKEYDAIQAAAQLKVQWRDNPVLPGSGNLWKSMRELDSTGQAKAYTRLDVGNIDAALASAAHVVSQTYAYPYNAHGGIGPQAVIADVRPTSAVVLTGTENPNRLHAMLARVLGLPQSAIRLKCFPGCVAYGNDAPYEDAAVSAALMSQILGKPVRLQFMRWEEHGWDSFAPAQTMDIRGGVDAKGKLVGLDYTVLVHPHANSNVQTAEVLTGAPAQQAVPSPDPLVGYAGRQGDVLGEISATPQYDQPNLRLTLKSLPLLGHYLSTGCFRACQAPQALFGVEQMIDELAYAAKMDPYLFRIQNITTGKDPNPNVNAPEYPSPGSSERWAAVLHAAAQAANWRPRVAASNLSEATVVSGRGIAVSAGDAPDTRAAVVAEIEVNKKTGKILVKHLYVAQDSGLIINPELVENQMIGAAMQGVSRTFEEVRFNKSHVTSVDWVTYPILRFKDSPKVTAIVVNRPDVQPRGVGEEAHPQPSTAVANAFFDATGVRMRTAPMTPPRVRAVLKAAGVA